MNKYLADTTLIIEHLRGNVKAKEFLHIHHPSISIITSAELIQGARDKQELAFVKKIEMSLPHISLDKKISQKAITLLADFHLSDGILFLDALIAATAIEHKLILVTENVKHFRFIKELDILPQDKAFSL